MSENQEYPGPSAKGFSTSHIGPFNKIVSPQDDTSPQDSYDSALREARIQPRLVPENHSLQSSYSSLDSDLTPVNYTLGRSSSSDPVINYATRDYVPHGKHTAQEKYPSRRTGKSSEGYRGQDNISLGGYSNEHSLSRAGYNTYNRRPYYSPPPDRQGSSSYPYDDIDSEENFFTDKSIRQAFIRKVYALIMCMMLFASAVISFMMLHTPTRMFVLQNMWLVIVSWAVYPVLLMILICFEKARRTVPWNYFVLFLITLTLSFMAGCSAARYNKFEVLAAFGITAVLCLGLTLFAFQTKWDFTVISGGLVIASLVMLIFGIVLIFWRNKIAMIGYACLGALLGCFFFIFDTQMIIGGNHRYAISPEEYVFAAITLFSDMINIFIMVMNIIGLSRS